LAVIRHAVFEKLNKNNAPASQYQSVPHIGLSRHTSLHTLLSYHTSQFHVSKEGQSAQKGSKTVRVKGFGTWETSQFWKTAILQRRPGSQLKSLAALDRGQSLPNLRPTPVSHNRLATLRLMGAAFRSPHARPCGLDNGDSPPSAHQSQRDGELEIAVYQFVFRNWQLRICKIDVDHAETERAARRLKFYGDWSVQTTKDFHQGKPRRRKGSGTARHAELPASPTITPPICV